MVVVSESPRLSLNGSGFVEPESVQPTIGSSYPQTWGSRGIRFINVGFLFSFLVN